VQRLVDVGDVGLGAHAANIRVHLPATSTGAVAASEAVFLAAGWCGASLLT